MVFEPSRFIIGIWLVGRLCDTALNRNDAAHSALIIDLIMLKRIMTEMVDSARAWREWL